MWIYIFIFYLTHNIIYDRHTLLPAYLHHHVQLFGLVWLLFGTTPTTIINIFFPVTNLYESDDKRRDDTIATSTHEGSELLQHLL